MRERKEKAPTHKNVLVFKFVISLGGVFCMIEQPQEMSGMNYYSRWSVLRFEAAAEAIHNIAPVLLSEQ